jgi:hypothetical protein
MERYYIFESGRMIAATPTREEAIEVIRRHQSRELQYYIRNEYSIIKGTEEFIPYQ